MSNTVPEAWVKMPSEAEIRARRFGNDINPYDFGFITKMERLVAAHGRIGRAFLFLLREVMFKPGHLTRQEREMVAAVAAAAQDCHY